MIGVGGSIAVPWGRDGLAVGVAGGGCIGTGGGGMASCGSVDKILNRRCLKMGIMLLELTQGHTLQQVHARQLYSCCLCKLVEGLLAIAMLHDKLMDCFGRLADGRPRLLVHVLQDCAERGRVPRPSTLAWCGVELGLRARKAWPLPPPWLPPRLDLQCCMTAKRPPPCPPSCAPS